MPPKKSPPLGIHRTMPILEIVTLIPEAKKVLAEYGLHCFSCAGSEFETLQEGCMSHGFADEEIDELVDDLNQMLAEMPARPETLTITTAAAHAIGKIAADENRKDEFLAVIADATGGFCMEFRPEPDAADHTFKNSDVPSVRILASPLTLKRIGGAVIDFRDGRFKLDLPEDAGKIGCGCSGEMADCGCKSDQKGK